MKPRVWIISSLLLLQCCIVSGQYYETGLNDLADQFLIKADSLFDIKNYASADSCFQEVLNSLEQEINSTSSKQNIFFIQLRKVECIIGQKEKKLASSKLDSLLTIIEKEYGQQSLLTGMGYFLKGKSSSSYEDAFTFYSLAAEIRKKTLPKGHRDIILSTEKMALVNRALKNNKEAMKYSQRFLALVKANPKVDSLLMVRAYSDQGVQNYIESLYDLSISYFDSSYQLAIKCLPPNHKNIKVLTMNLSLLHEVLGNSEMHREFLNKTIELYANADDNVHLPGLASAYSSLSNSHYMENDFITARIYLDSVRMIIEKFPEPKYDHEILYRIRASSLERKLSNRIAHLEKALEIIEIFPYISVVNESSVYNNLAVAYSALGLQSKRKLYLDKSYDLLLSKSPNNFSAIATALLNLASFHLDCGEYDLAFEMNRKSINYRRKGKADKMYLEPIHWFQLVSIVLAKDDLVAAKSYVDSSFQVLEALELDTLHYLRGTWHLKKAELNLKAISLDTALHHVNKSISIRKDDIGFGTINSIEELTLKHDILIALNEDNKAKEFLIQAIRDYGVVKEEQNWTIENTYRFNLWKAYSLLQLYQSNYLSTMPMQEGVNFIKVVASLIGEIKTYYIDNIAEVEFYDSIKVFFDLSVDYLYKMAESQKSKECQNLLVDLIFINRDLRTSKGLNFDQKSSSQKERDAYLVKSDMLVQQLQQLKKDDVNDSTYLKAKEELFSFERKSASEFSHIERSNDSQSVVEFNQIDILLKHLKNAHGLIFYTGKNHIYTVTICQNKIRIKRDERQAIEELVFKIDPLLTDWSSWRDDLYYSNSELFISFVDSLSRILINDEMCSSKDLVIFADGVLLNLPFDILFTESVNDDWGFRNLPYLIRDKQISYASTIDQLQQDEKSLKRQKHYLGIAPIYSNEDTISHLRGKETPLYYNQLEVSQTNDLVDTGKALLGSEATKSAFLSSLKDVDWLHLAVHAKFDDEVTYQSYLSFANQDSIDNNLSAYEIANLDLDVELAVLSACETNKGKNKNGLGLLGIARAFQISGCNNLMITNWLVDDAASQKMITEMFRQKVNGRSTPDALHQSKIHYLNNASEKLSHPIYWAGFNYYGAIHFEDGGIQYWWLIFPLLLFAFIFLYKKV